MSCRSGFVIDNNYFCPCQIGIHEQSVLESDVSISSFKQKCTCNKVAICIKERFLHLFGLTGCCFTYRFDLLLNNVFVIVILRGICYLLGPCMDRIPSRSVTSEMTALKFFFSISFLRWHIVWYPDAPPATM